MVEKMTIEQFRQIRAQLDRILNQIEENSKDEAIQNNLIEQYYSLQCYLFQFDLSEIPFEEWKDFLLFSDVAHAIDLSHTGANLDFELIDHVLDDTSEEKVSFHGCNIRNINKMGSFSSERIFDEDTIRTNPNFFLTGIFSEEFKKKFYSCSIVISDLLNLTEEQLAELKQKNIEQHMNYSTFNRYLYDLLGFDKYIQLYRHSPQEWEAVNSLLSYDNSIICGYATWASYGQPLEELLKEIQEADVPDIKNKCFDVCRHIILYSRSSLRRTSFPQLFIHENPDLFLVNTDVPEDVKDRFFKRELSFIDVIRCPDVFRSFPIDAFLNYQYRFVSDIVERYGPGKLQELIFQHPDVFAHMDEDNNIYDFDTSFKKCLAQNNSLESAFIQSTREILFKYGEDREVLKHIPDWVSSMHFQFVDELTSNEQFSNLTDGPLYVFDKNQRTVIETLGFDNIRRFEQETGFFTHKGFDRSSDLEMFHVFLYFLTKRNEDDLAKNGIDFQNGNLSYEEFLTQFARLLDFMKSRNIFTDYPDYDWIQGPFRDQHPEIFINIDDPVLKEAFYKNRITPDFLFHHKEYIPYLVDKNLSFTIRANTKLMEMGLVDEANHTMIPHYPNFIDEYAARYGNEKVLRLIAKYGKALSELTIPNLNHEIEDEQKMEASIQKAICEGIKKGSISDYAYLSEIPEIVENLSTFFLSDDAPEELKKHFYHVSNNYGLTFLGLKQHKDWLSFLKEKEIVFSIKKTKSYHADALQSYFELFGEELGIKLGIRHAETVTKMIESQQVDLMKKWYDKTGGKFIPDYVVMLNFHLEEADKFLISGSNWSTLMKIQSFAQSYEPREAMLKLAYSFGAFDQDQRGFKKLLELLTSLPKKIDAEDGGYVFERIDREIDLYSQRELFYHNIGIIDDNGDNRIESPDMTPEEKEEAFRQMIEYVKSGNYTDLFDTETLLTFLETLKKEKVPIDFSMPIFAQIYRKNEDESYSLTINPQSYPKTAQLVRNMLEKFQNLPIISPTSAHRYLGGFDLQYDPEFRDFFLANLENLFYDRKYLAAISQIQRRFSEIKRVYSNIPLTLELAFSYIRDNKYEHVNTGNKEVTSIAAINNYSQSDFEILQQIFNYAKQRVFSSIPRVEGETEKYRYAILRLDDPLAMAIGKLTDCCQRLHEAGCQCMEHSMVDRNGRLFVVWNKEGEIVAQSWVWRNKDVLCFDNIEVPDRQMWRHGVPKGREDEGIRNAFTDEVLDIYLKAAQELMDEDERVFRELFESGKITQEQYEGLRLGKITTGVGYSNIKGSFERLKRDKEIARPLAFTPPVDIGGHYYTSDSTTQYILQQRDDRKSYDGPTLQVHSDTYIAFDDSNITKNHLITLIDLEKTTRPNDYMRDLSKICQNPSEHPVSDIADYYHMNRETTKIIIRPNFAIIYELKDDKVVIGDLLYNTKVDNRDQQMDMERQVIMQMRLALDQISDGREIDISRLDDEQKEMYTKITQITDEMDIERGVSHA